MRLYQLLLCLAWAASSALAYDLYGGYERIMYFYAYRMDAAKNGKAKVIGAGCRPSGGSGPCDIYDFVKYLNNDGKRPVLANLPANFDPNNPDPDYTARALRDADATGTYNTNKIYSTLGRNDVDGAFKKVAEFVAGAQHANEVTDTMRTSVKTASKRVYNLRTAANLAAFGDHLATIHNEGAIVRVDYAVGNGETVKTIDYNATKAKIKKLPGQATYNVSNELINFQNADPGHADKVKGAKTAYEMVSGTTTACAAK